MYGEAYNMRTNIDIDDRLLEEAFRYTTAKTKKELIHQALEVFIETQQKNEPAGFKRPQEHRSVYEKYWSVFINDSYQFGDITLFAG